MLPVSTDQSRHVVVLVPCRNPINFHIKVAVEANITRFHCALHQRYNVGSWQTVTVGMFCPKVVSNLGKHRKRNLKFFLKRAHLDYGISCWHMQKSRLYIRNFCYCHIHLMSKCPSRLCNTSGFVVVEKCDKATVSGRHLPEMNTIFGWLGIDSFFWENLI